MDRSRLMRAIFLCALTVSAVASASAQRPANPYMPLQHGDRVRLIEAQLAGDRAVTLRIATKPGAVTAVAEAITSGGGAVRFRDDKLAYLRARVPIESVMQLVARTDIVVLSVNEGGASLAFGSRDEGGVREPVLVRTTARNGAKQTKQAQGGTRRLASPGPTTPAINPYAPAGDLGSPQFIAANKT